MRYRLTTRPAGSEGPDRGSSRRVATRRRPRCDDRQPEAGDAGEGRDSRPRGTAGQHELEQRHRITETLLQRAERAVTPPDPESGTFRDQGGDRDPHRPATTPGERTRPDVTEAGQLDARDQHVRGAEQPSRGSHGHVSWPAVEVGSDGQQPRPASVISARKNSPSS